MTDLTVLREEIDKIDRQIVDLYERRMDVCREVAEYKIRTGKKVLDKEREKAKISTLTGLASNDFYRHGIEELFEQIMSMSRKLQYQLLAEAGAIGKLAFMEVPSIEKEKVRVVFQGVEGANSEAAMRAYFGDRVNSFHVASFREAMEAIEEGMADFAVLPIENSSAGIVSEIYDLLVEFENYIVGEQVLKIESCLMGVKGAKLSDIQAVYSHPQALMQTARYLEEHGWQQISMSNTAAAAQMVAREQDKSRAAIGNSLAARLYGLDILEPEISYNSSNSTRFIIVTNQKIYRKDAEKISICCEIAHESGSLYHAMSHFIYNRLNMCKIESRPIEGRNWEYRFFIDFEGNLNDSAVKNALRGLRDETRNMRILGNY
ncbi:MAG: prephenate dehydratase [Oscillospiraceae bacterium]|nr:prephenate dehydratase [Oscillospiraceae bacterium]